MNEDVSTYLEVFRNLQHRRVADHDDLGDVLDGKVNRVTTTKAVPSCTKGRDALLFQGSDDGVKMRTSAGLVMALGEPCSPVESFLRWKLGRVYWEG
jgi:hypothetical protein